jgi:hypothetical protein
MMLASLLFVTRPGSEIADFDEAAHYVGMPEYDEGAEPIQLIINFRNQDDKDTFVTMNHLDQPYHSKNGKAKTIWWPPKVNEDPSSVKFQPLDFKPNA